MRIIIESDERSGTSVTQPTTQPVTTAPLSAGPPAASLLEASGSQITSISSTQHGDAANAGPPSPDLVSAIKKVSSAQTSSFAGAGFGSATDAGASPLQ